DDGGRRLGGLAALRPARSNSNEPRDLLGSDRVHGGRSRGGGPEDSGPALLGAALLPRILPARPGERGRPPRLPARRRRELPEVRARWLTRREGPEKFRDWVRTAGR